MSDATGPRIDVERAVHERYRRGARTREPALCCPVDYEPRYLEAIPREIVERDYGCGDPSRDIRPGEVVLDLGSGAGKVCYIAAQIVGPDGQVIGIEMNEEMLALARRHQPEIAHRLGYDNVAFRRGRIQDLRTDLDALDARLHRCPIGSADDLQCFESSRAEQRATRPLVGDESVDVVVSNCVLNLVREEDRRALFGEIFRVLRRGGRAVVSDIVAGEPVPERLRCDALLWSGCVSGAFEETAFLQAFAAAGFHGIEIVRREAAPWRTVEGIEFRAITVRAFKARGPCGDPKDLIPVETPVAAVATGCCAPGSRC